jgi:cell division cycle 2-like
MSGKRSRWDEEEEEDVQPTKKEKTTKKKKNKKTKKREESPPEVQEAPPEQRSTAPSTTSSVLGTRTPAEPSTPQPRAGRAFPRLFPLDPPAILPCRSVDLYEKLNHIEEGSYGIVYRARDTLTQEIVALKKLKLEREKTGFPITSLREISTLMAARHPNIVNIREVVMGEGLSQYVFEGKAVIVGCLL